MKESISVACSHGARRIPRVVRQACTWEQTDPLFIPLRALLHAAGIDSLMDNFGKYKSNDDDKALGTRAQHQQCG